MSELTLPNLPTTIDPAAREAECDAAIHHLNKEAGVTRHDIDAAKSQNLPKAVAAFEKELRAIEARKAEFVAVRLQAIVDGATAEAEEFEPKAAEALPALESAQAEFKAAEEKLKAAKRAHGWANGRALAARGRAERAASELAELKGPWPSSKSIGSQGQGTTMTTDRELRLVRPNGR